MHLTRILLDADDNGLIRSVAFAKALKYMAHQMVDDQDPAAVKVGLTHDDIKNKTPKGRAFLQWLGVAKREEDPDFWVKRTERQMIDLTWAEPDTRILFVTDVRFLNEMEMIRKHGGLVWRIERPVMFAEQAKDTHISETALDTYQDWDSVLVANNLSELLEQVRVQLRRLGLL